MIEGPLQGPLEPGSYVSNPVITAKKWSEDEIRLNLDLSDANEDIVMSHHPIPTPDDLRHEFRDADTFTSIDANQMFQQWMIAKDKRRIFTFRTPWGLYRYVRLPSGVNCASAECNNNLRAILEGLPGIVQIVVVVVVDSVEEAGPSMVVGLALKVREVCTKALALQPAVVDVVHQDDHDVVLVLVEHARVVLHSIPATSELWGDAKFLLLKPTGLSLSFYFFFFSVLMS